MNSKAVLGGFGTIFANDLAFSTGSTWLVGVDSRAKKTGLLDVKGMLTLPSVLQFSETGFSESVFPNAGYKIATYGTLAGLDALNTYLTPQGLLLDLKTIENTLVLKQQPAPVVQQSWGFWAELTGALAAVWGDIKGGIGGSQ